MGRKRKYTLKNTLRNRKSYCEEIMNGYIKLNPDYENDEFYKQLNQFYNEYKVDSVVKINAKAEDKTKWLESTAKRVNHIYDNYQPYLRRKKLEKIIK